MMKVAFLDRDGVINNDTGYVHKIEDFCFADGCVDALTLLQKKGFALIIVTNQSGIGRGYYTEQDYQQLTEWYVSELSRQGVNITDVFHCPHAPEDACDCRKPKAGLFLQAANQYTIDFSSSIMVGDKASDIDAAAAVGIPRRYLLQESGEYSRLLDCALHLE
jgi:D-glycero-D-manno-heptose 1,7-bisphosphate phosphatase